jgi:hypothetical protein
MHENFAVEDRDPLSLYKTIIETHSGASAVDKIALQSEVTRKYSNLKMNSHESLPDYKKRFDTAIANLAAAHDGHIPNMYSQERFSLDFMEGLDVIRYSSLKLAYRNKTLHNRPDTLSKAYTIAAAWQAEVNIGGYTKIVDASIYVHRDDKKAKKGKQGSVEVTKSGGGKFCELHGPDCNHETKNCFKLKQIAKDMFKDESEKVNNTVSKEESGKSKDKKKKSEPPVTAVDQSEHHPMTMHVCESTFTTFSHIEATLSSGELTLKKTHVLLDNQSTINIVHNPELLTNIRSCKYLPRISGIAGSVQPTKVGDSKFFGEVIYEPSAPANILSWARVCDQYKIDWIQDEQKFVLNLPDRIWEFTRRGNLYVTDISMAKRNCFVTTVSDNKAKYTVREVEGADRAAQLKSRLGYASDKDLIWMLENGKILNAPVEKADIVRRHLIYGPSLANQKGAATEKTPRQGQFEISTLYREVQVGQVLSVDVMFVNKVPYLISVSKPLGFTMVDCLKKGRDAKHLFDALWRHVSIYQQHYFEIKGVITDRESAMQVILPLLRTHGIQSNVSGSGQHAPVVENKIRRIKERVRAHVTTMPYKLYSVLLMWLVYFCVSRLNMMPCRTRMNPISPHEALTGRKLDFKRDIPVGFGEYCQAVIPSNIFKNDVNKQRTAACITLCPTSNLQGSVMMLQLKTLKVVARDHWQTMPMPDMAIEYLNQLHQQEKEKQPELTEFQFRDHEVEGGEVEEPKIDFIATPTMDIYDREVPQLPEVFPVDEPEEEDEPSLRIRTPAEVVEEQIEESQQEPHPSEINEAASIEEASPQPEPTPPVHSHTTRIGSGSIPRKTYSDRHRPSNPALSYNISARAAIRKLGDKAIRSMVAEMHNLHSNRSFKPIDPRKLDVEACRRIIRSHMFLKEKFSSTGKNCLRESTEKYGKVRKFFNPLRTFQGTGKYEKVRKSTGIFSVLFRTFS